MPSEHDLELPIVIGEGEGDEGMASIIDDGLLNVIIGGQTKDAAAAESRRIQRGDQLSADASAMWGIAMTTPTILAAAGFRVMQQSGGWPASSGTGTGAPT